MTFAWNIYFLFFRQRHGNYETVCCHSQLSIRLAVVVAVAVAVIVNAIFASIIYNYGSCSPTTIDSGIVYRTVRRLRQSICYSYTIFFTFQQNQHKGIV
jgi:hypothetical protein